MVHYKFCHTWKDINGQVFFDSKPWKYISSALSGVCKTKTEAGSADSEDAEDQSEAGGNLKGRAPNSSHAMNDEKQGLLTTSRDPVIPAASPTIDPDHGRERGHECKVEVSPIIPFRLCPTASERETCVHCKLLIKCVDPDRCCVNLEHAVHNHIEHTEGCI